MNTLLAGDMNQIFYVVKVNGVAVTAKTSDRHVAESQKAQLPPESQAVAIVEAVTESGNQMLLG